TLSSDGRKLARQVAATLMEVSDVEGGRPVLLPRHGGYHQYMYVHLDDRCLVLRAGKLIYLLAWSRGRLEVSTGAGGGGGLLPLTTRPARRPVPRLAHYDQERFVTGIDGPLVVVVDCFGQEALLDRSRTL